MSVKNNATCSICGSGYHVCYACNSSIKLQPWKIHCCSVDCYKTYQVVRGFSTGVYTKDEFKSKLQNIDLSNLDNYREHIKAIIKDALKENTASEPIVENSLAEEETVVEKPVVSRKRNHKVNNETKAE